jgi:glycosyltransferase involved in cell wall biosynthesis
MSPGFKITSGQEIGIPVSRADSPAPKVSIVIACLNEYRSIGGCVDSAIRALHTLGISGEVIVADNGSTDGSIEVAQAHGARVVNAIVRGYGSAIRTGIQAARGDFIITGDADGSHDFGEIGLFIDKLQEGYEFVLGSRLLGNIKPNAMLWHHRRIGTPMLSWLVRVFFGVRITDINTGMRGLTRSAAQKLDLRTTGFESCSESLIKAAKARMRITEVPITTWPEQRERPPHLRSFRDGWRHLRLIMLSAPNWLFLLPGGFFMAVGISIVLWLLPGPVFAGRIGLNLNTISLAMMLILVGVHIFSIGLFVKVFCHTEKLSGIQVGLTRWLKRLRLEHGLALGALLFGFGAIGDGIVFRQWAQQGFGYLHPVRTVFFCSLALFLGIEVIFSSVFLSMLGVARDTFIGE